MKFTCIIVDDEDPARQLIESFLKDINFIEISDSCNSAVEALNILNHKNIDIMFLDINMPKMDGLNFLKTLKNPPKVIITTAYRDFAVEGYELDVTDYLCKPFSFVRFLAAINKTINRIKLENTLQNSNIKTKTPEITNVNPYVFIKSDKKSYRIDLNSILYIEAVGDYVKVITTDKSLITYMYLKDIEKLLPSNSYPRVHRSFLVSISKIDSIEGNQIIIGKNRIPIGRNYKGNFMSLLQKIT